MSLLQIANSIMTTARMFAVGPDTGQECVPIHNYCHEHRKHRTEQRWTMPDCYFQPREGPVWVMPEPKVETLYLAPTIINYQEAHIGGNGIINQRILSPGDDASIVAPICPSSETVQVFVETGHPGTDY